MLKLLKRSAKTVVKLPLAMAWDVISLGNMGDGDSTSKVLHEHRVRKQYDETIDVLNDLSKISR